MPVVRLRHDTFEALRKAQLEGEATVDDVIRRLVGLEVTTAKIRKEHSGLRRATHKWSKWPFYKMAVGQHYDFPKPINNWPGLLAAAERASLEGKKFNIPMTSNTPYIRVTRTK